MTWLDRIHLPAGMTTRAFAAGLAIPGYAFVLRGERVIGRVALWGYALLTAVFIFWLGYPIANVAFGLMLSIHGSSLIFLLHPWLAGARLPFRLVLGLALLLLLGAGFYSPLRRNIETNWVLPLRIKGDVVIVRTLASSTSIRRGERVVYRIESLDVGNAHRAGGLVLARAGYGCGAVIGLPGDRITFTTHSFELNGVARQRLANMPVAGEFVVPEKHWFIWPELAISNAANASAATIAATLVQLGTVSEAQFVGKPFKRWFWRRQHLS